jgi:hypothetical protein
MCTRGSIPSRSRLRQSGKCIAPFSREPLIDALRAPEVRVQRRHVAGEELVLDF